jgi:hypothetical protein
MTMQETFTENAKKTGITEQQIAEVLSVSKDLAAMFGGDIEKQLSSNGLLSENKRS